MSNTYGACSLQLPSNYVLMDTKEMEYLEGGGIGQTVAYYAVQYGIDAIIGAAFGAGLYGLVSGLRAVAKDQLKTAIKNALLKWTTVTIANRLVGSVIGVIANYGLTSVGGAVASWLDRLDGAADRQIYFSRIGG